jgi:hypothetical protein
MEFSVTGFWRRADRRRSFPVAFQKTFRRPGNAWHINRSFVFLHAGGYADGVRRKHQRSRGLRMRKCQEVRRLQYGITDHPAVLDKDS